MRPALSLLSRPMMRALRSATSTCTRMRCVTLLMMRATSKKRTSAMMSVREMILSS